MRLEEYKKYFSQFKEVLLEWNNDTDCKPLRALRLEWYNVTDDSNANKGKDWIANENNHKDLECQKDRYKQFLAWIEDDFGKNKDDYRIPSLEVTSDDDDDGQGEGDGGGSTEGCPPFNEWIESEDAEEAGVPWSAGPSNRFIPLENCRNTPDVFFVNKDDGQDSVEAQTGRRPERNEFEKVYCYYCDEQSDNTHKYEYKKYYRLKTTEQEEEVENCDGFVTFFRDEENNDICVTTDPRRLERYLGIEPYDLLASNNQDKIYNLTGKYGNEIYNECVVEAPYWSGRDTEFKMRTHCITKYKNLLQQVMGSSSSDTDEDTVAGLAQLLEPINAEVKMCLDMQCIETVSIYRGNVDSYISNEIASWSEGSPERMESMNKRFGLKKKAIDSWFTPYLEKKLERQVDLKNIPFIDEPMNWPDQNFIDIVENSIALLLTKPSSLKRIRNQGEAYIKVEDTGGNLDGTYLIRFNTSSLIPKNIIPIVDTKRKTEFCRKLVTTARQNGFIGTDRNTYLSQVDSLTPKQKVFAEKMRKFVKGYECTTTDPYFILQ